MTRPFRLFLLAAALAGGLLPALADTPDEQLAAASAQFDAHHYADAAKTLDAFLAAHPTHPKAAAAALALGRCRSELKEWTAAIPAYQKAIAAKDPSVTTYAELGLGEAALRTSRWQVAADALNAATQAALTPEQGAIAWDWLGQADAQIGKFAEANKAYQVVIAQYRQSDYAADAFFGAGLAEERLGDMEGARRDLRTFVSDFPSSANDAPARMELGQMALTDKRWHDAQTQFRAVLDAGPSAAADASTRQAAQEGLVNALLGSGDDAGAATQIQSMLAQMPPQDTHRSAAELMLGNALYRQKQYAPARAAYQAASVSPDPTLAAQGLYWSAQADLQQGQTADAARLLKQLAARYPQSPLAARARQQTAYQAAADDAGTLRLARLDIGAKNDAGAVASLKSLLATHPAPDTAAEAEYLLGTAENDLSEAQPATAALSAAVQAAPSAPWTPDAQTQLAWLSINRKQPDQAETAANAALAAHGTPNLPPLLEEQARLALIQAESDQQKWDAAVRQCQTLLAENPSPATAEAATYILASIDQEQGKAADALPLWQKVVSQYPQSQYAPEASLHIADAKFRAGQFQDAADAYAQILAQYPSSPFAAQARYERGSSLYNLTQYAAAAAEFDQIAADPAAGAYRADGLYWAGASYQKLGKNPEAIARLSRFVADYPANAHAANAKVRLAALKAVAGP